MVKFWQTSGKNFITHANGLTLDQIGFLKSLQLGDRLIIFVNEDGTLTLKKAMNLKEK